MYKTEVRNILNDLKAFLYPAVSINKVILFGSASRGEDNEFSDIDIAVVSDDFEGKDIFERSKITMEAERKVLKKYSIPIDLIKLTTSEYLNNEKMISDYVKLGIEIF